MAARVKAAISFIAWVCWCAREVVEKERGMGWTSEFPRRCYLKGL